MVVLIYNQDKYLQDFALNFGKCHGISNSEEYTVVSVKEGQLCSFCLQ